jgi:hypothetical protein
VISCILLRYFTIETKCYHLLQDENDQISWDGRGDPHRKVSKTDMVSSWCNASEIPLYFGRSGFQVLLYVVVL